MLGATERGQVTSNEKELKNYALQNDVEHSIIFIDDVNNVEDYLRASDIFVLPTMFDDGMSNALLEAMTCGLPVIASNIPQVMCAFQQGDGLFFSRETLWL